MKEGDVLCLMFEMGLAVCMLSVCPMNKRRNRNLSGAVASFRQREMVSDLDGSGEVVRSEETPDIYFRDR